MTEMEGPFPRFPEVTEEVINSAREKQSFQPIAFEYYKCAATAALQFACIDTKSPCWKTKNKLELGVIRGNLSRIAKLAKAVLEQSQNCESREIVWILNRGVTESAINLQWCMKTDSKKRFELFVHSGVQGDLKLRNEIINNLKQKVEESKLEKRMLKSLDRLAISSGFKWEDVPEKAKLPDFYSRLKSLDVEELYLGMQVFPSQSMHGAWSDLVANYLIEKENEFFPRDDSAEPEDVLYLLPAMVILDALIACAKYCLIGDDVIATCHNYFSEARNNSLLMIQESCKDSYIK